MSHSNPPTDHNEEKMDEIPPLQSCKSSKTEKEKDQEESKMTQNGPNQDPKNPPLNKQGEFIFIKPMLDLRHKAFALKVQEDHSSDLRLFSDENIEALKRFEEGGYM
jgi:hypothetical protein